MDEMRRARERRLAATLAALGTGVLLLAPPFGRAAVREVPTEFATIQAAIDASAAGDTVLVLPGTHRGPGNREIEFRGKDLVVMSRDGPRRTTIDCEYAGRAFHLREFETRAARIEGFTIVNGRAMSGAGIRCAVSSPSIVRCHLSDNAATQIGGGVYLICSDALVEACVIQRNLVGNVGLGGGLASECGAPLIKDCVITGNWAHEGGGVCFSGAGTHRLEGCTIAGNLGSYGGGLAGILPYLLERCIVWGNCAVIDGDEIDGVGELRCCVVDSTGVRDPVIYDEDCRFTRPDFCAPNSCGWSIGGDWSLHEGSICLAENSPCGRQIGALGWGCGVIPGEGACCFPDGSCRTLTSEQCAVEQGSYLGDGTSCEPDPCAATPVEVTTWGRVKAKYR